MSTPGTFQITYRDFCDARHEGERDTFETYARSVDERFRQIEENTKASLLISSEMRSSSNEWRGALRDLIETRAEKAALAKLEDRAGSLENWKSNIEGRLWLAVFLVPIVTSILLKVFT